jgi:hypothetical protein
MFISRLYTYFKKYWLYFTIFITAFISLFLYFLKKKSDAIEQSNREDNAFNLGEIKGKLIETNNATNLKLKSIEKADRILDNKIKKIENIKDKSERRKQIDLLLKTICILFFLTCSCATKSISYPSYLPPKINIQTQQQEEEIDIEKEYGKIPFKQALITLKDGSTMLLNGGFVFDDYETLRYIKINKQLESCSNKLDLMIKAYNDLYDNSVKAEKIWQDKLNEDNNFIDKYQYELGVLTGSGMCLGVLYSTQVIIK